MTDDSAIHDAFSAGLIEVRAGGEVWRVASRTRAGRVRRLPTPSRADRVDPSTGYRRVRLGKFGSAVAHRAVWISAHGPIAPGLEVNHKNRDKADNRVDNLELLTHVKNVQHAYATGVQMPRGEDNGQHKLTEAQVLEIRTLASAGESQRVIARRFAVARTLVQRITQGRAWRHLAWPEPAP